PPKPVLRKLRWRWLRRVRALWSGQLAWPLRAGRNRAGDLAKASIGARGRGDHAAYPGVWRALRAGVGPAPRALAAQRSARGGGRPGRAAVRGPRARLVPSTCGSRPRARGSASRECPGHARHRARSGSTGGLAGPFLGALSSVLRAPRVGSKSERVAPSVILKDVVQGYS